MKRTVSEILDNEYKDFSLYVLEHRAIPSVIDGFKPTQRKIIFTGIKHVKNSSNKVATLAGKVISDAAYHHGNVSCEEGIVNLTQNFKNNIPLFERIGQFGSLRSPKASASRYISVKMSKIFDLVYRDNELLENKIDESEKIEPYFYLPIIPMVLVNGSTGIAVGHASNILMRDKKDVINKCISYLENKKITKIKPNIDGFNGSFVNDKENNKKWYINGIYSKKSSTITVSELPPSMTFEKFTDILDILEEKKVISRYENNIKNGVIDYKIIFNNINKLKEDDIIKTLKLTDIISENFTTLDENGKLKIFDSAEEILKYFVDFRLTYYDKRKDYLIDKLTKDIKILDYKAKFIKAIIDGVMVINKRKKEDIIKDLVKQKFDKIDDSFDYLLNMPIYSLTKEKYDELINKMKDLKIDLTDTKKAVPKQWYLDELNELLKKV